MADPSKPVEASVVQPRQSRRKQPAPASVGSAPGSGEDAPRKVMLQARHDLAAGMVDTDMRATPGLDQERRAALVPGAGGKPLKDSVR